MATALTLRRATAADIAAVDTLLARSYPALLKADYPPSVMVTALPIISRAQPGLVVSGSYFVVESDAGTLLGSGGWTAAPPRGEARGPSLAHVRHVVTDHRHIRRGIGRYLMTHVLDTARQAGHARLSCLSTRTAVPFYAAMGFASEGEVGIDLRPGISFPAVRMSRTL